MPSAQGQRWKISRPWAPFRRCRVHTCPSRSTGLQILDQKWRAQHSPAAQSDERRQKSPSSPAGGRSVPSSDGARGRAAPRGRAYLWRRAARRARASVGAAPRGRARPARELRAGVRGACRALRGGEEEAAPSAPRVPTPLPRPARAPRPGRPSPLLQAVPGQHMASRRQRLRRLLHARQSGGPPPRAAPPQNSSGPQSSSSEQGKGCGRAEGQRRFPPPGNPRQPPGRPAPTCRVAAGGALLLPSKGAGAAAAGAALAAAPTLMALELRPPPAPARPAQLRAASSASRARIARLSRPVRPVPSVLRRCAPCPRAALPARRRLFIPGGLPPAPALRGGGMGFQRAPGGCAAVPPPRGRGFRNGGGSSAALPSWRQRRPAGRGRSAPPAPRSLGGLEESPPRRSPPVHSTDLGRGGRAAAGGAGPGEALPLMRGDQRGAAPPAPRPRGPPTARLRHCAPWRPRRGTAARRAPLATRARSVVLLISFYFFLMKCSGRKCSPSSNCQRCWAHGGAA